MEHKTFDLIEVKADGHAGKFTALASVFGNVDHVGDRVMPGAFSKTLADWREAGDPIPVILSHKWDDPMSHIGYADPNDVTQTSKGLLVKGSLDIEDNPVAKQVWKLMRDRRLKGWSFGYVTPDGGEHLGDDGVNEITQVDLVEVGPTLKGANPEAELQAVKSLAQDAIVTEDALSKQVEKAQKEMSIAAAMAKAVWTTAYINTLPDSSFLYVESGGEKDGEGKTTPRTLRHFPYKDAAGSIDLPHLRNALARIPQSNLPANVKDRLTTRARSLLSNASDSAGASLDPERKDDDVFTERYIAELPDESFLYVEPGGELDENGKTVPRSLRRFPYQDAEGNVSESLLRKAIAELPSSPELSRVVKDSVAMRARQLLDAKSAPEPVLSPGEVDATSDPVVETRAQDPLRRNVDRERLRIALGR